MPRDKRTTEDIKSLIVSIRHLERIVSDNLSKLPNYGGQCMCNNKETVQFIHHGNMFEEIETYCIECGGQREN